MIKGCHYVQVRVRRLLSASVVVISHAEYVGVILNHLKKLKLSVLVTSVLENSLDCHDFVRVEIGARVDDTKGTVGNYFVKSVLLPGLLLSHQFYNIKYGDHLHIGRYLDKFPSKVKKLFCLT